MPFSVNPSIAVALAAAHQGQDKPLVPIGDIATRRTNMEFIMTHASSRISKPDVETKEFTTTSKDGTTIQLKWYTNSKTTRTEAGPAILHLHMGGLISGQLTYMTALHQHYTQQTGVPILDVEYRLAPEVQQPKILEDCYAALVYLHDHASELKVNPHRIGVLGESAGGNLAAALCHYTRQQNGPAISKQILIYPMLDDRTLDTIPFLEQSFLIWDHYDNTTAWQAALGKDKAGKDGVEPIFAPSRMTIEDAKGLPPAYIDCGELDIFRDESIDYASKLLKAGVSCELHIFPAVPHAFELMAPEEEVTKTAMAARLAAISSV